MTIWIGMEQAFIGADFTQVGTAPKIPRNMYTTTGESTFTPVLGPNFC